VPIAKSEVLGRRHYTPLRYPGGKGKLAPYLRQLVIANELDGGDYVEPYAGGAAIALELLAQGHVARVHINDISRPVHSFWLSVLEHTEELCRLVRDTPRTVEAWDGQKKVMLRQAEHDPLTVGFATFFLNRTNRSGILNGGIIGGREQKGAWKMDARYNASELVRRIKAVAALKTNIVLTGLDALAFLQEGASRWPERTLIYLDPPYYVKGRDLYYQYYRHDDHQRIAGFVRSEVTRQRWIVSYDDAPEIRDLYSGCQQAAYSIAYSARSARQGAEIMFFSDNLDIVPLIGAGPTDRQSRRVGVSRAPK